MQQTLRGTGTCSDARFARFVKTSVVRAIRSGARTFEDLLLSLPSIYPTEVLNAVDQIRGLSSVDDELLRRIRTDAGARPRRVARGGSLLPLPHPLDFEWRFSEETCRELLVGAKEMTRRGETILLYGTPGLAYAAVSLPVRNRRVVFVGADTAVTRRLRCLNDTAGRPISVLVGEGVERGCASAVLVDPPWYLDYLEPMLAGAAAACRLDGVVVAGLPPLGIRPGASAERDAVDLLLERQGLDRVALEELGISYETPFFEANALAAVGVCVPAVWRRGDLAVYRRRTAFRGRTVAPVSPLEVWEEVEIEGMRIRVRFERGVSASREVLESVVRGDVLPSVSRRDPRRARANVWTSGNRIFRTGDPMLVLEAASACRDEGVSGGTRSLWRSVAEQDVLATLVARLQRIAEIEAEERAGFERGGRNRFGWAA
ncbi:MAG: hypothetical protein OXP74_11335 [Acidobacteriota bacterium]|nr:hypothetical protein [Acidobacteriota bacterium]